MTLHVNDDLPYDDKAENRRLVASAGTGSRRNIVAENGSRVVVLRCESY